MSGRKLWKLPYWLIPSVVLTVVLTTVGLLVASPPKWEWLGVGESQEISQVTTETIESQSKKTVTTVKYEQAKSLWDWLGLLGVPISVALLGWWLQQLQQKRSEEQAKEEILQVYFDRISTLLVDKNLLAISTKVEIATEIEPEQQNEAISEQEELLNAATDVIRARTLSILRRLENDPERKISVLQFLFESGVIHKLNLNLSHANLQGINLLAVDPYGVSLNGINLSSANLRDAQLFAVDLSGTDLSGADLTGADLTGADLTGTELIAVDFSGANLSYANLSRTHFFSAGFRNADLSHANLEDAHFEYANFSGAKFNQTQVKYTWFTDVKGLKLRQIKRAKNWLEAKYNPDLQKQINLLKPETPPDDSDDCPF